MNSKFLHPIAPFMFIFFALFTTSSCSLFKDTVAVNDKEEVSKSEEEFKIETKTETESEKEADKPTETKKNNKGVKKMYALFKTNKGNFKALLHHTKAPKTVENFVGLAEGTREFTDPKTGKKVKRPYYDGLIFHRIIPNFMIQGGDPLGTGTGGPGYSFNDEFHPELKHDKKGVLSMANSGPNTNGSQFFVTVGATPHLDAQRSQNRGYSIFGEVVEGYDVVESISEVSTGAQDRPVEPVIINKLEIIRE